MSTIVPADTPIFHIVKLYPQYSLLLTEDFIDLSLAEKQAGEYVDRDGVKCMILQCLATIEPDKGGK